MRRRKLLIGLPSAGAFTAGFGAAVFPASAQLRTITVTLVGGQTVTVQVDAPADTPADQIPLPGVSTPVDSVTQDAPAPAPADTGSTPPADTGTRGGPAAPADTGTSTSPAPEAAPASTSTDAQQAPTISSGAQAPSISAGGQQGQKTTGKALRKDAKDAADKAAKTIAEAPQGTVIRQGDGVPTPANPTFSAALPGPAPIGVPNFFIDKFRIPPFLLPIYQAAGIEYGVRWEVLAGINEIETDYGRNLNVSSAGALGWMQFMPSTWKQYGVDANHDGKKDPFNPVDAIFAAARYLKAAGADTDVRKAIFAYNHADWYVDSVLMRARLIGGLPSDLVGSLTGLTQGHFPVSAKVTYADDLSQRAINAKIARRHNAATPVEANKSRRGINIYAKAGSPAIATQDGKVVNIGKTKRLGRFIQLQDVYGNTYTYAHLKKIAAAYAVPKAQTVSKAEVAKELDLPHKDPKPTQAASAGTQPGAKTAAKKAVNGSQEVSSQPAARKVTVTGSTQVKVTKERAFANPSRPASYKKGGEEQLLNRDFQSGSTQYQAGYTKV